MATRGSGAAAVSLVAGIGSTATIPVAVYATRFSDSYDLLHAGQEAAFDLDDRPDVTVRALS